ncbi:PhzF family phenazine biosynthesis protein [Halegenticoccus soli]|uniref:PhzF family phenazine biosynthesis protein n=1 Tax=Halegenticoccus soli TaxID=1985678 RepID=UPI000C6EBBDD|nr:PhzF family phenazine biosynthesis protein [Halegenticoccus soli]
MPTTTFHIVDVFAERKYAGNPLAVVEGGADLSDDEMQAIAAEMSYSETTFVESTEPDEGGYDVRIFTPQAEIPFAGHPTLGTASVLRGLIDGAATGTGGSDDEPDGEIVLNLPVGQIPVRIEETDGRETLWMTQRPPTFGEAFDDETVAEIVSLSPGALDGAWRPQVVSTGLPTLVVPLSDRSALTRAEANRQAYDAFVERTGAKNVLVFCPEPRSGDNDLAARMFAPGLGIAEDPATGSSNGCLAAYLAEHGYFGDEPVDARVEQGYEMGRPSLLHLRAEKRGEEITVDVGGSVVPIARGQLL